MEVFALFLPEIKELLQAKDFSQLKDFLKKVHSMDLAEGWKYLEDQEKILVFKLLGSRRAVEVFEHLRLDEQSYLLNNLENVQVSLILNDMAPDERVELFQDLPKRVVKKLFGLMKSEEVDDVRKLLKFKEGTAGNLMTTEFVELKKEMTARRAILKLQESQRAGQTKQIYSVYCTDEQHHLIGGVSLQMLIMSPPDMLIRDIMSSMELIKLNAKIDAEDVAKRFTKYDLLDMPVTDGENKLLGVITVDDVVDIIHREATEDIYGMGKISGAGSAAETSYTQTSIFTMFRKRAVWLFILLLIGTFVSGRLLKNYAYMIESMVVLAFFIPMLMDSGGNTGQQSLCMIVRGLATGEVKLTQVRHIIRKELIVGAFMGVVMGLVAMASVFFILGTEFYIALTVGISLAIVIPIAALTGALLPLFFERIGLDPAVAASPFITTVVDATCILVYFEIARRLVLKSG